MYARMGSDKMKTRIITVLLFGAFLLVGSQTATAASDNWRYLTPTEKDRVIQNYQRWQKLPPQDKEHLRDEWNRWQRLPSDERERIKQRYDQQRRDRNRRGD
jgi:Protein of unknown function (DUF3106)